MKIAHTSDWHLGKKLFKYSRREEHVYFLNWIKRFCIQEKVDCLCISGDIFDTPNPPHEDLKTYYNFLDELTKNSDIHVVIIAGNHDSGKFLEAPKEFLNKRNIHVFGEVSKHNSLIIEKDGEEIEFICLPFFRTHEILNIAKEEGILQSDLKMVDSDDVSNIIHQTIEHLTRPKTQKSILLAHHLFGEYYLSGSEQSVSLTGISSISKTILDNFNYVALGHIHSNQKISENTYYSGSPIAFRFSENKNKKINLIEINENTIISQVDIPTSKKVKSLKTIEEKLESDIQKINQESDEYPLGTLLELKIQSNSQIQYSDSDIRKMLNKNVELISFQQIVSISDENDESINIENYTFDELYSKFIESKFDDKEIEKKSKEDFNLLLERIKTNKSVWDHYEN